MYIYFGYNPQIDFIIFPLFKIRLFLSLPNFTWSFFELSVSFEDFKQEIAKIIDNCRR